MKEILLVSLFVLQLSVLFLMSEGIKINQAIVLRVIAAIMFFCGITQLVNWAG